jgi:hypothetical protein
MKTSKTLKVILAVSGVLAMGFGLTILSVPAWLHALNGVELGANASLLSEIRAPGGALLACGLLIAAGAFSARLTLTSILVSTVVYSAYGLSRIVSLAVDGRPAAPLLQAMIAELVIGGIGAIALRTALRHDRALGPSI